MSQARNGRRGAVFSVRITDDERALLETMQSTDGPRSLGPWLLWRALRGETPRTVVPIRGSSGYYPSSGSTAVAGEGITRAIATRCILDLCAGSGSWSEPYANAGYHVVRISLPNDIRTFIPPSDVWGVLAAPPCDQFSLARNGQPKPRDFVRGMECVNACLRIIHQSAPRWWALENPVGLLSRWLGTPRDVFDPCDFGDPWTKRTALWGSFRNPRRGPFVSPVGGGPLCELCDPDRRRTTWCNNSAHRAVTPKGFARAFFEANP